MKIGRLVTMLGLLLFSFQTYAQDLIQKVPKDAQLVATFNNKAFFDNLNVDTLNATLTRINFFKNLFNDKDNQAAYKLQDLGFDLNSKAYLFIKGTDSIQYIGGLIPLSNRKQFESLLKDKGTIQTVNNMSTLYSADKTFRMSWDDHTIYCLGGISEGYFFKNSAIMERYGFLENYDVAASAVEETYVEDDFDDYVYEDSVIDTALSWDEDELEYIAEEGEAADSVLSWEEFNEDDEYAIVDSILGQDDYSDDYYAEYARIHNHNDSIKNTLISTWLEIEFDSFINGKNGSYNAKNIKPLSKNTIFSLHVEKLKDLYGSLLGPDYNILGSLGMPRYVWNKWDNVEGTNQDYYGIDTYTGQVEIDGNKLKINGEVSLNKDIAKQYKEIYKRGINPKFYTYLDKDILGFMSLNINTEAYLKNIPSLIEKFYTPFLPSQQDYIKLGATMFDVFVDDKAIGKVLKGDNLFILNGVTKAEVTYKDYEYDDDYNYSEVEKTKMETIPQFLWMFSSDDTRIFNQLLKIGLKENKIVDHNGVFEVIEKNNRSGIKIFIQIKDGIVFIGNDYDKMKAIRTNTVSSKGYAPYVNIAKKNSMAFLFHTKRIPVLIEELDIPIQGSSKKMVEELNTYGDFVMLSPGVEGTKFKVESSLDFPKTKPNSLLFLLGTFERLITGSK